MLRKPEGYSTNFRCVENDSNMYYMVHLAGKKIGHSKTMSTHWEILDYSLLVHYFYGSIL